MKDDYQKKIEAERLAYCKSLLIAAGFDITKETEIELHFKFKNETIRLFPYSGWFTGKSVIDGRGIKKLMEQIQPVTA